MFFDTLAPGQEFRSPSRTLTDAHYLFFAGLSGDNHPSHYDAEWARRTPWGRPLAHGLLLMSLTALGASEVTHRMEGLILVEQGCRFLKPAVAGDTLTPRHRVEEVRREDRRGFVRLTVWLDNQRGERILEGFHLYQARLSPP